MEKEAKKTLVDRIWDFLASVKLAIIIFAVIALTSIVGTVLEQQAAPERNLEVLAKLFGDSAAPTLFSMFDAMGFMDMYRSWWFVSLLAMFSANLLICSIDRFPAIWKVVRAPMRPMDEERIKGMPIKSELSVKGDPEKVKESARSALKSAGFAFAEEKEEGGIQLYAEKGKFSRLGVYVTHFSIVIILAGAVLGVFLGFKGQLNLPEGVGYPVAFERTGPLSREAANEQNIIVDALLGAGGDARSAAMRLGVPEEQLKSRMELLGVRPLGFLVRCEDFEVEFYGNSDMPKSYTSLLTVVEGGREVMSKWITVNDPLSYKGITFYQSSYGYTPKNEGIRYILKVTSATGASETMRVVEGQKFLIPGTQVEASVSSFSPALSLDQSGRPFTYADTMNNPAVELTVKDGANQYVKWSLERYPDTGLLRGGHSVQLLDVWGAQYTGLQVRRDPGVWMVYLGCALMSLGLFVAFFVSHRRIWVRLRTSKGSTAVVIGGSANKNRQAFERTVEKVASLLREGGNK